MIVQSTSPDETPIVSTNQLRPSENPLVSALNESTVMSSPRALSPASAAGPLRVSAGSASSSSSSVTSSQSVHRSGGSSGALGYSGDEVVAVADRDPRSLGTGSPSVTSRRGSLVLKKNRVTKTSTAKLHSSVYSKKQIYAALFIQKWYRRRRLMSLVDTAVFCNRRRRAVLREIVATEESYVASLTVLVNEFLERLTPLSSEVEMQNVFLGCRELLNVHMEFYNTLRTRVPG